MDAKKLFLLDSGAQYVDGTTDITRTVHFGEPTARQKECFTRVLQVFFFFFLVICLINKALRIITSLFIPKCLGVRGLIVCFGS